MSKKTSALASRARKPRRESPAKRRLLDAAIKLLGKLRPSEITTTMVLQEAGAARNTLYLHFENQAALIESALLSIFLDGVYQNADMLEKSLKQSRDKPDFIRHAEKIIRVS
jgi:AcrR family transcriptional regulator